MALTNWKPLLKAEDAVQRVKARRGDPIPWGSVRVAHLDTGYSFHHALGFAAPPDALVPGTDLSAIVVEDGKDFLKKNRGTAFDPLTPFELWDGLVLQEGGHGTRPATVMAGDDPDDGFKGVAPGLPLLCCRVTEGSVLLGPRADAVAAALRFVAGAANRSARAPVAAICLGRPGGHTPMGEAVDACYEKGVIVVAACGQLIDSVTYPARYARAIGAGGLEMNGSDLAPYYRYERGQTSDGYAFVDVWAPASGLRRGHVGPRFPGATHPNYDYGYVEDDVSGTTYACAHVAAAAALWLAFHGDDLAIYDTKPWQRVEAFRQVLKTHNPGSRFPTAETRRLKRHGNDAVVLNVDKLLQAPLPAPSSLARART